MPDTQAAAATTATVAGPATSVKEAASIKEMVGSVTVASDFQMMLSARIAHIDRLVSLQLNEVLRNAGFQKLEGSWRELNLLGQSPEHSPDQSESHLAFSVENKLSDEPGAPNLKVDLNFKSVADFEPENVARQIKPLKELLDLRTRLSDLRSSLQGNVKLEEFLLDAVGNKEKLDKLKTNLREHNHA